jgi:hypothetical protein
MEPPRRTAASKDETVDSLLRRARKIASRRGSVGSIESKSENRSETGRENPRAGKDHCTSRAKSENRRGTGRENPRAGKDHWTNADG